MENKVFEENLACIKKYDNNLYNKLLMYNSKKANIKINKTLKEEYNLILDNTEIHSNSGAIEEAKKIASSIQDKKDSIRIIYGLGLGYLADEIANKVKIGKIIIYEPNLDILKVVLSIASIDALFMENVILCQDIETFSKNIKNYVNEKSDISVTFLNSYKNLYFDDIKNLLETAQKIQGEYKGNLNTYYKKAPSAINSTFSNLKKIISNPDISELKNIYKGKTALVISAGPSLAENIEIIKNNQDKFIIFAVGAALKLLASNNIKPDFVVNIETFSTLAQFQNTDTKNCYMILEAYSTPHVMVLESKKTFNYISKGNFINDWLRDMLNIKNEVKSYGTVSYSALSSAFLMGFNKIIIIGQDLAYKKGACYAKGSQYESLEYIFLKEQNKFMVRTHNLKEYAKSFETKYLTEQEALKVAKKSIEQINKNLTSVLGQDGTMLPSKNDYAIFIKIFENCAIEFKKQNPSLKLINSSSNGALIKGFENIELKEVVNELESIDRIDLTNINANYDKQRIMHYINTLLPYLADYASKIEKLACLCQEVLSGLEINHTYSENIKVLLVKIQELIHTIVSISSDKKADFTLSIYTKLLLKPLDNNAFRDIEATKKTILKFKNNCEKILPFIEKYIKKLNDIQSVIFK